MNLRSFFVILLFFLFTYCSDSNKEVFVSKNINDKELIDLKPRNYFDTLSYDSKFRLVVDTSYTGSNAFGCFGIGYHLIIGRPMSSELPEKISVLYNRLKPYNLKKYDTISVLPNEIQNFENNGIGVIYIASDTIINGQLSENILGSEYEAIWADEIVY